MVGRAGGGGGGTAGGRCRGGNLVHIIHVGGFYFCKGHMGWGVHQNDPVVWPADSAGWNNAPQFGRPNRPGRCQPDFWPKSSAAVSAGRHRRPVLRPADTAVGYFTFGQADTAAEPHRRPIPMSLRSAPGGWLC